MQEGFFGFSFFGAAQEADDAGLVDFYLIDDTDANKLLVDDTDGDKFLYDDTEA